MSASEDTFTTLCQLLEPFNAAKIGLKPETDISGDLNIDIPLNVLSETRSIADLVNVVEGRLAKV